MSHGLIGYWLAEALWDVATAGGDGIACYAKAFDYVVETATPLQVRHVGRVADAIMPEPERWACYEADYGAEYGRLMGFMRNRCVALSVPYETPHADALAFVARLHEGGFWARLCEAYDSGRDRGPRRAAEILATLTSPFPWCGVHAFAGHKGPDALLCRDTSMRDALAAVGPYGRGRVYKW